MLDSLDRELLDTDRISRVSRVKRFLELWACDDGFRRALESDPAAAAQLAGLEMDPEDLRPLWDLSFRGCELDEVRARLGRVTPLVEDYHEVRRQKRALGERLRRESAPAEPAFRAWRDRQMARTRGELPPALDESIQHPTFAFELSVGCSVGCWFCGVDAPRLGAHFLYEGDNVRLWQDILAAVHAITGARAGRRNFLYWASDPLDNPDYERFATDFQEVFGGFPHTTTAQVHKQFERGRELLRFTGADEPFLIRFSVLTVPILKRIHAQFTAEELAFVELVPQTSGAVFPKTRAGRALAGAVAEARADQLTAEDDGRTIACVSGFIVNMVNRTIRLVSPCAASERWPHGYHLYEEAGFADAAEFDAVMRGMIARHMPASPPPGRPVRFRRNLEFRAGAAGFTLKERCAEHVFGESGLIRTLGVLIDAGVHSPAAIADRFHDEYGFGAEFTASWLQDLYDAGVIDAEPVPSGAGHDAG